MNVDAFSCDRMVNGGSSDERLRLHLATHFTCVAQIFDGPSGSSNLGFLLPVPHVKRRLGV
ncbi:hypothetical protein [Nitratireductor sp.]|uniref:hypothetical protein n=1 Tax=Nitratireductor sp. TaxID=1872084 RepID=UPI00262353F2|nr:hypothetical protein [Nitratireductor sp.]MCV0381161.1 hypothetical protein [Nitratireductor sp.]